MSTPTGPNDPGSAYPAIPGSGSAAPSLVGWIGPAAAIALGGVDVPLEWPSGAVTIVGEGIALDPEDATLINVAEPGMYALSVMVQLAAGAEPGVITVAIPNFVTDTGYLWQTSDHAHMYYPGDLMQGKEMLQNFPPAYLKPGGVSIALQFAPDSAILDSSYVYLVKVG